MFSFTNAGIFLGMIIRGYLKELKHQVKVHFVQISRELRANRKYVGFIYFKLVTWKFIELVIISFMANISRFGTALFILVLSKYCLKYSIILLVITVHLFCAGLSFTLLGLQYQGCKIRILWWSGIFAAQI